MELHQLRAFVVVAEELNFSRAAARLHLSPSPLSRRIRELERDLGTRLFDRGTRHVRLTPAGEELVPRALDVLARVRSAERSVRRSSGQSTELLIGMRAVPPQLRRALVDDVLTATAPDAEIRILPMESAAQVGEILSGGLAFGVTFERTQDSRLDALPVLRETMAVALPDQPEYERLSVVTPDDVRGLRIVTLTSPPRLSAEPPLPRASAAYRSMAMGVVDGGQLIPGGIASLVAGGGHCAFLMANPDSPWHRSIVGPGVIVRPLPRGFPKVTTSLVWLANRSHPDDLGRFVSAARRRFRPILEL